MRTEQAVEREAVAPDQDEDLVTVTATRRILVAEDNEAMLQVLTRAMRNDGHEVVQARNGLELMHWVELMTQWHQPVPLLDLIVTDLRMPMYSGQECLERLRFCGDPTPVILITAFGDAQVHREALASGARAVFDKPLDLANLRGAVWRMLR